MARISTYPLISTATINDLLIGTDVENMNETKNFRISQIVDLVVVGSYVPYTGAVDNVILGNNTISGAAFIVNGGTSSQFLKADGSIDNTIYTPQSRTLTINGVTNDLSANRTWIIPLINTLTTTGTGGPATLVGSVLNVPQYQAQGNYITALTGEATASGPGSSAVTLSNSAVISKILTGLNITGGTVTATDSILQAFGKVQNQINGLVGGVIYKGTWDASTNTPTLTSSVGVQGSYYVVSVPGSTNLNGITDWKLGDWAIFNGSAWEKIDNTDAVVSVNGYTGAVVLTASDVGAVPTSRTLSINGTSYDLTTNRSWSVGDVFTSGSYSNPSWITSLGWNKITSTPTTLSGYGITDAVSSSTTLTINGTAYDLSASRSWSVGTVTSIATSGPITGGTITTSGTIGITQATTLTSGYLSSTDWNTFNNKQAAISASSPITFSANTVGITQATASSNGYLSSTDWSTFNSKQNALTNPVTGTGTAYTIPMWSGTTTLTNSILSYGSDTLTATFSSTTGATVVFNNTGLTAYAYTIQMNNYGSTRLTTHSYTDGDVATSIGGTQVVKIFANGNVTLGTATTSAGYKLDVTGTARVTGDFRAESNLELPGIASATDTYVLYYNSTTKRVSYGVVSGTGTVTSVDMTVPTGLSISGNPITTSGTLALTFTAGYSIPTTANQSNWDAAYTFTSNFPSQTGNNGKYLKTDGTNLSWADASTSLATLSDVQLTTPLATQVLTYNGTKWVNQAPAINVSANLFNYYNFI